VSHLYRYKRLDRLLLGVVLQRGIFEEHGVKLYLAGGCRDRRLLRLLKTIVCQYQIEDVVTFLGAVPPADIAPLIRGCTGFVFQSTIENCPSALLEALAEGVPIACSGIEPMREIGGDGPVYFDPHSPKDIGNALASLVTREELRVSLGCRAFSRSRELPTWTEVGTYTLGVLEEAVLAGC
jgi:glycosyltransferase involved in cell wall biosynthesis